MFNENDKELEELVGAVSFINGILLLITGLAIIGAIALAIFVVKQFAGEVENQTTFMSLEDRCEFVVKTSGEQFHLSEPSAGTYKYELYATPDGYIEVWKCN